MNELEIAIWARGVRKQYGGKNGIMALDNLDITVEKGTIYALLGSSGCGKTTFLGSVVGSRKIDSGEIRILGYLPGVVPVRSIGYMPQEMALVAELSVKDCLEHYGWIFGMSNEEIQTKLNFLTRLMDLPPSNTLVKDLSGGQQRRVSFAISLLHDPDILILDEPTVGLDPVIRQNIWNHLLELAEKHNKTILITTHYIEEARHTHRIGLMRNGRLMAESNPQVLMNMFECSTLEETFMLLSERQEKGDGEISDGRIPEEVLMPQTKQSRLHVVKNKTKWEKVVEKVNFTNKRHAKALLTKALYKFTRSYPTIFFASLFPLVGISVLFVTVGNNPNVSIGVLNHELGFHADCDSYRAEHFTGSRLVSNISHCQYEGLSCKYLEGFPPEISKHIYYKSAKEANEALRSGVITAYLEFAANYTNLQATLRDNYFLEDDDLEQVQINIYHDSSNFPIAQYLQKIIYERYESFSRNLEEKCGHNSRWIEPATHFQKPIYGSFDDSYRDYASPGIFAMSSNFFGLTLSATAIITERTDGVWERTLVAGVTKAEIMIYQTLILFVVNLIQNVALTILAFFIFEMKTHGSIITAFLICVIEGAVGVSCGMFLSVACKNISDAIMISLGTLFPIMSVCSICWPYEGLHPVLKVISYFTPPMPAIVAMQNVVLRGWSLYHYKVFCGLIGGLGWVASVSLASVLVLKYEKR